MKIKILFSTTLMILFLCSVKAQVIPNYNFENWVNGPNSAPDGWEDHSSHHAGFYPASQTSDKYLGTYAVKLENKITVGDTTKGQISTTRPNSQEGFGPAFPVAVRYNNLKGFYKYTPLNGDSTQIIVYITKTGYVGPWGNLLAFGQKNMGAALTYTPFSVGYLDSLTNFFYNDNIIIPDSGYIEISAFKAIGSTMYNLPPLGNSILIVDALNFDTYLTGINEDMDITTNFNLFPNVNSGNFTVNFNTSDIDFTTIKIYDPEGREIKNLFSGDLSAGNHEFNYTMTELSNGNYLYVVATGKGYRSEKICIQK
jgi:hypothetical protein